MSIALTLGLGAAIGVLLGLLGGGGSILAVPALVYLLGMGVEQAIPTSLVVVGVAAAVGAIPKVLAAQVQWRLAGVFAASGIPAAVLGSAIGRQMPQSVLMIGFATLMVAAAFAMMRDDLGAGTACRVGDSGIDWRRCMSRSIPTGVVVGLLTGLFGVGGGFLIIPALVLMLGVQMPIAVGTSLVIIVANSAAGFASHLGGGVHIDWAVTAGFVGAAIAGSLVAGQFGTKVDTGQLRRWFAYLVLAVAATVLVDTTLIR